MSLFRLITTLVFVAFTCTTTFAATFNVNSTNDTVDATPGNGICADVSGDCTLRAAIGEANSTVAADIIVLPAGTFKISIAGIAEDMNATGDFDILNALTIRGAGQGSSIVDGNFLDRVFNFFGPGDFTLESLDVINGSVPGDVGAGVAHFGTMTTFTVTSCSFEDGFAGSGGGALYVGDTTLRITDSIFDRNISFSVGGAIFHAGTKPLAIANSDFTGNRSASGGGDAYYGGTGPVTVSGSEFADSFSSSIGGSFYISTSELVSFTNSTFTNTRGSSAGGAAYISTGGN